MPAGSTLVILGGSGSGKTVLMKHMIGLLKPDQGQVIVDGEDIVPFGPQDLERVRRKFGMVFQAAALFDSMTVYENVAFRCASTARNSRKTRCARWCASKLGIVGLEERGAQVPRGPLGRHAQARGPGPGHRARPEDRALRRADHRASTPSPPTTSTR